MVDHNTRQPFRTRVAHALTALIIGALSGVVSFVSLLVMGEFFADAFAVDDPDVNVSLPLAAMYALTTGPVFGIFAVVFGMSRMKLDATWALVFFFLSIIAMFCAVMVALTVYAPGDDPENGPGFAVSYALASVCGAGLLISITLLISDVSNTGEVFWAGIVIPTLVASAVGWLMQESMGLFQGYHDAALFIGWQAAFMYVLSGLRVRRPNAA